MKFKGSVEINQSREKVTQLFADPNHLKEYQDGFVKKVLVKGTAGKAGAVSNLHYAAGKRKMVLTETVVANRLPDYFEARYHHEHMDNDMRCTFTAIGDNKTRYDYEFEYTRINWILPKLMAILFPGMYQRQGDKWMNQFKEFAEKQ